MSFSTFSGPVRVGTVRYTTGTTAGTVRNTGVIVVAQTVNLTAAQVAAGTGTLCALPAGAMITGVQFYTTTLFNTATTLKITANGADWATAATVTSAGYYPQTGASTAVPAVGATDTLVTYTATGAVTSGAVTVIISYIVRNADGAINPTSFQN